MREGGARGGTRTRTSAWTPGSRPGASTGGFATRAKCLCSEMGTPGRIRTFSPEFVARGHVLVQGRGTARAAVPTGIEPVSTLLDRQAAYPDAYGTLGLPRGDHPDSNRDQEVHSLSCEPLHHGHHQQESQSARGESNADLPVIGQLHYLYATSGESTVWVAGIEPAASSFQARLSTSDLHPENHSGVPAGCRTPVSGLRARQTGRCSTGTMGFDCHRAAPARRAVRPDAELARVLA